MFGLIFVDLISASHDMVICCGSFAMSFWFSISIHSAFMLLLKLSQNSLFADFRLFPGVWFMVTSLLTVHLIPV
jgi:hypothetical protein